MSRTPSDLADSKGFTKVKNHEEVVSTSNIVKPWKEGDPEMTVKEILAAAIKKFWKNGKTPEEQRKKRDKNIDTVIKEKKKLKK